MDSEGSGDAPAGEGGDLPGDFDEDNLGAEVAGNLEVGEDVGEFFGAVHAERAHGVAGTPAAEEDGIVADGLGGKVDGGRRLFVAAGFLDGESPAFAEEPEGFPTIGKVFSNGWKTFAVFSNDWKIFFQWLESSGLFFQ